ncbi:MAG: peptidase M50B-like-domain-containing protein [Olpidium bornovanus]|uniref:Peptidase M50B-like-domain-containing protein n=1 Tax=Olpidium bornovanus TaxID=278681 RepID=A0A8H8DGB6_9FUNG|nr:MAG: peptidase M50B-like-domain-containing protein [Olpidium bornovanus]
MAALPTTADAVTQSILAPSAEQWKTIHFIIGYVVGICVLWHLPYLQHLLYPFKLVTIAFHEFGHAAAGKGTGAQIEGIEVDPNEGGVTRMRGGTQCVTLPAGYIGSTVFGFCRLRHPRFEGGLHPSLARPAVHPVLGPEHAHPGRDARIHRPHRPPLVGAAAGPPGRARVLPQILYTVHGRHVRAIFPLG